MVGTTIDNAIDRVRRDSLIASRGPFNLLDAAINDTTSTTFALEDAIGHIGVGEILSVDYENMLVRGTSASLKQVTVIRGFQSTADTHADGALVEVASRFPKSSLLDYAYHEILSWQRKLFQVETVTISITAGTTHYDLPTAGKPEAILDIRIDPVTVSTVWWNPSWVADRHVSAPAKLIRGLDPGDPDAVKLQFLRQPLNTTTAKVTVAEEFDLTPFTSTTDLVTDVGLQPEWLDLLEVGMKWRCLTSTVIGRSDWRSANVARAAEEVTPLDTVRAASHLRDLRETKLSDAMVALRGDWPWKAW